MSTLLGHELTAELCERLSGKEIGAQEGKVILLVTVDDRNWPHPAMLSYREVVAKSAKRIDVAVGKASTSARNLRERGNLAIVLTDAGMNFYIKGKATETVSALAPVPFMSVFRVDVEQLIEDQEPGAAITGGITFRRDQTSEAARIGEKVFRALTEQV
ncbi:MAG TPA: pyridoxamine 5'-phosphate oxidase family protein [Candidatus Acidoferrales bacterium]|nr:pyridoxamine 5'-phosphate oxidase family protein [Candidatus Acidoferrales bacterium]